MEANRHRDATKVANQRRGKKTNTQEVSVQLLVVVTPINFTRQG